VPAKNNAGSNFTPAVSLCRSNACVLWQMYERASQCTGLGKKDRDFYTDQYLS
jgi:hypothetical protein